MNPITKLEFKKIIRSKSVIIACLLLSVYVFFVLFISIKSDYYYVLHNEKSKLIEGLESIKIRKQEEHKIAGYLDESKLKSIINYYHELKSDKNNIDDNNELTDIADCKYWDKYITIQKLIGMAYSGIEKFDFNRIDNINGNDGKKFYSNRIKTIKDYLKMDYGVKLFDEKDKKAIIELADKLRTPLYYDYFYGWKRLIESLYFLNIVIIIILCFCVVRVFTKEFESGMIMVILPTINGKKRLASSKVKASIIFSTIIYLILNLLFFILIMTVYGYTGWKSAIQIDSLYWLSIYNLKFYQAYLLGLGTGYCCCLFMILLTLWVSNIVKKALLTISISGAIFLLPLFIRTDHLSKHILNIIEVIPVKALNFIMNLRQQYFLTIYGNKILRGYITPIILLVLSCIFILFIIKRFNKQQV